MQFSPLHENVQVRNYAMHANMFFISQLCCWASS